MTGGATGLEQKQDFGSTGLVRATNETEQDSGGAIEARQGERRQGAGELDGTSSDAERKRRDDKRQKQTRHGAGSESRRTAKETGLKKVEGRQQNETESRRGEEAKSNGKANQRDGDGTR